jgi:hypothetical protein
MFPVVRRSVTIRSRHTFDFPWVCDGCGLSTVAHVNAEGVGTATAAYAGPSTVAARQRASSSAERSAIRTLGMCPCPRCGYGAKAFRDKLRVWEKKTASRAAVRRAILYGGLGLGVVSSAGGGVALASLTGAVAWMVICTLSTLVAHAMTGPGPRPYDLPFVPRNVSFDPLPRPLRPSSVKQRAAGVAGRGSADSGHLVAHDERPSSAHQRACAAV